MSLIKIEEYKKRVDTDGSLYINPNLVVTITKSKFSNDTWSVTFVNGTTITVDDNNLDVILRSTKTIMDNIGDLFQ